MHTPRFLIIAVVCAFVIATLHRSDAVDIPVSALGWYMNTGLHDTANTNSLTGFVPPNSTFRSYYAWAVNTVPNAPRYKPPRFDFVLSNDTAPGSFGGLIDPLTIRCTEIVLPDPASVLLAYPDGSAVGQQIYAALADSNATLYGEVAIGSDALNGGLKSMIFNADGLAAIVRTVGTANQFMMGCYLENEAQIVLTAEVPTFVRISSGDQPLTDFNLVVEPLQSAVTYTVAAVPSPVFAGAIMEVNVLFANAGPDDEPFPITCNFELPEEVSFTAPNNSCVVAAGAVVCDMGSGLAVNASETLGISLRVLSSLLDGTMLTTTVSCSPTLQLVTVNTLVRTSADIAAIITAPIQHRKDENMDLTIGCTNNGPSDGLMTQCEVTIPADAEFVVSDRCGQPNGHGTNLECFLSTLESGASLSATITLSYANTNYTDGNEVTHSISCSTTTTDPDASNDVASATTRFGAVNITPDPTQRTSSGSALSIPSFTSLFLRFISLII